MAFPGGRMPGYLGGAGAGQPNSNEPLSPEQQQALMTKQFQAAFESCPIKAVISSGVGFALGGAFGLFMASMSYDTMGGAGSQRLVDLPLRQQLREGFKDMGKRSYSSAKGFGLIGGMFAGTECVIESYRAKNDMYNGMSAGCVTGGALAVKAGPQAAAFGCAGFAAFSAAIDWYLRSD